jgi:Ca2+-binding RTX toxin-like protein
MLLRYSRGTSFVDSAATALEPTFSYVAGNGYRFAAAASGGYALTDLTTGERFTFTGIDIALDSLSLDFSDATAAVDLRGGVNGDVLRGGSADDLLIGGGGADALFGGAGDDSLSVSHNYATVDGGEGIDTLVIDPGIILTLRNGAASGIERVVVGNGSEAAFQSLTESVGTLQSRSTAEGAVTISGTAVNDRIIGGAGQDRLFGNGGDDTIVITSTPRHIIGGDGDDLLILQGGGTFTLGDMHLSEIERINITGGGTLDITGVHFQPGKLIGSGSAALTVTGSDYSDQINGGSGDDILTGGYGGDRIIGGAGADTFVFRQHWDIGGAGARDRIMDFSHADGDRISLEGAAPYIGGSFQFIGDAAFSGSGAPELRAFEKGGRYIVQGDVNDDGKADFAFFVTSEDGPLVASDFIL